jgi:outer membrane biosynthesis protein TonB
MMLQTNLVFVRGGRVIQWVTPIRPVKKYMVFWGPSEQLVSRGTKYVFTDAELPVSMRELLDAATPMPVEEARGFVEAAAAAPAPAPEVVEEAVAVAAPAPAPEVVEEAVAVAAPAPAPEVVEEAVAVPAPAPAPAPEVVEEAAPEVVEAPAPEVTAEAPEQKEGEELELLDEEVPILEG